MRATVLVLCLLIGRASAAPLVIATSPPAPTAIATSPAATTAIAPAPAAPSWWRGIRYSAIGEGVAAIQRRGQAGVAGAFQCRLDVVLRSGVAIGAEVRFEGPFASDESDTPGLLSVLAIASRDVGRIRVHAGVGPGWSTDGGEIRSRVLAASAGADLPLARAGGDGPNLWLALRGDGATDATLAATLGLRVELDLLDH